MKKLHKVLHYYLPYNLKIIIQHRNQPDFEGNLTLPYLSDCTGVKPLLIPLSKLTESQLFEFYNFGKHCNDESSFEIRKIEKLKNGVGWSIRLKHKTPQFNLDDGYYYMECGISINQEFTIDKFIWFFKNHIDIFNLIESGQAIEK